MRPSKDDMHLGIAAVVASRSTCHRLKVGCVLASARGHVLSTGYNGRAAGLPNCSEIRVEVRDGTREFVNNHCRNSDAPSGEPNGCEAIHAEQNALLQCRDVYAVETCYCTHSPCLVCVKLLLNTSCRRVVFVEEFPHPDARRLWTEAGREWLPGAVSEGEGRSCLWKRLKTLPLSFTPGRRLKGLRRAAWLLCLLGCGGPPTSGPCAELAGEDLSRCERSRADCDERCLGRVKAFGCSQASGGQTSLTCSCAYGPSD
jgi:dCMP deaminase